MTAEPYTIEMVCLASSRKHGGRCIAGRQVINGNAIRSWVRPVGDRPHQEVTDEERRYSDGREPGLLDVFRLRLLKPLPHRHQAENWLIDPTYHWRFVSSLHRDRVTLNAICSVDHPLWQNGVHSSIGENDRVPYSMTQMCADSLRFISVQDMAVRQASGKRRARFTYLDETYDLAVTDMCFRSSLVGHGTVECHLEHAFITVSLGEDFYGYCYKLVAAILEI